MFVEIRLFSLHRVNQLAVALANTNIREQEVVMIFTSDHICVPIPYMLGEVYCIFLIEPDRNVTPYLREVMYLREGFGKPGAGRNTLARKSDYAIGFDSIHAAPFSHTS